MKKKKLELKHKRELARFNNIEAWDGEWFCPNCQKVVKAYWCECGWAYFTYKDPGFSQVNTVSHIFFYSKDSILEYSRGNRYVEKIVFCSWEVRNDGKVGIESELKMIPEKKEFISKFIQYPIL